MNNCTFVDCLSDNVRDMLDNSDEDSSVHESDVDDEVDVLEELVDNSAEFEEQEEQDEADDWREWVEGEAKFSKFNWTLSDGYKPPIGHKPTTPLEYFQLFFTDELMQEIVNETNRFAAEKIAKVTPLRKKSMWTTWKEVTLPEFKAFVGCLINMAMNHKPEIEDFFSTDWVDYQPFFKEIFSRERFLQIFWNLHVCPPPTGPIAGTLSRSGKVRNVVLYLDKKFREYYIPKSKVSVDESTVGFKGKIIFKVYNKDKPVKWGIKIYVLSESDTGYICCLEPYFGKATTERMERQDLGVTSRIVLHLVNKLKESYGAVEGLHVFTDRFYTNMDLAQELCNMKVHLTGTILRNRKGLPLMIKKRKNGTRNVLKLKRGDMKAYRKNDRFSVIHWKDKNEVTMLSTLYDNSTQVIQRTRKQGVVEDVVKPTVVCKYNESMGGVDIADQYISSYGFTRKSLKWWRKVFFWLQEAALVNAYLLFNMNEGQGKCRQRQFRRMIISQLVGDIRNTNKKGRPAQLQDTTRLNGKLHLPFPLEGKKVRDCAVCSSRAEGGTRKRVRYYCKTCENQPGLCIGDCFEQYHTSKNIQNNGRN